MRKASSTYRYHYSILLLLLLLVDMQNTGAYSSYSHRCNPNDLGALYGFSRRLITHQIHDWPLADANFTNCCSWPGVSCALFSPSPISSSSSTNSSGLSVTRVVGLDLSGKGLDGVLSTSLAVLDKLSFLNRSYNFIPRPHPAGAIPLEALEDPSLVDRTEEFDFRGKPIDEAFIDNSYTHFPPQIEWIDLERVWEFEVSSSVGFKLEQLLRFYSRATMVNLESVAYNHLQGVIIPSGANHKEGDDNDEDKFVFFGVPFAVYLFMCRWDRNYDYD
ncbi:hypothetical protein OPV22_006107 [Ensete ventricosum]|uniref:Leucine-rich repeat-containing N-terminal plant-type domain-containing protein n=1 Tax=Ensete ventricosum TaxID=4639 RepID=A0AAV8RK45_ENSVE|nr:hypothetical protein OPV22_006107 [Ensete ventricosum]